MSAVKKRNRVVVRDHALPSYASTKKSNQTNPICWVAYSDDNDMACPVFSVRKKTIECRDRVPLPSHMDVSFAEVADIEKRLHTYTKRDENIVNAMVSKEAYSNWIDHHGVEIGIYDLLDPDEINKVSIHTLFKNPVLSSTDYRYPTEIATVLKNAQTFQHKERGEQPIHTWIHFKHDINPLLQSFDNFGSDEESRGCVVLATPYQLPMNRRKLLQIQSSLDDNIIPQQIPANFLRLAIDFGEKVKWV
jgi:hypothetical protein